MARTVVLRHETPDGTGHFDWFVEDLCMAEDHRLHSWRAEPAPDVAEEFRAVRTGMHRAAYLDFEGDIGGGRGVVRRVRRGTVLSCRVEADFAAIGVAWDGGPTAWYEGTAGGDGRWTFRGRTEPGVGRSH